MHDPIADTTGTDDLQAESNELSAVARFARHVVHDFNNVLGTALGNLELAQATLDKSSDSSGYLVKVDRALGRAAALTDELLLFAADRPAHPAAADPAAFIRQLKPKISARLAPGIAVELRLSGGELSVEVDAADFESAVLRLVDNAGDAMGEEGQLRISVEKHVLDGRDLPAGQSLSPGSYVVVAVTDNGTGMTEEIRSRALSPFFSTRRRSDRRGLGLSAVFGFAMRHRGGVDFAPRTGGGTCASLYLPCRKVEEE